MLGVQTCRSRTTSSSCSEVGQAFRGRGNVHAPPFGVFFGGRAEKCPIRTSAARARRAPGACAAELHGRLPRWRGEHLAEELPLVCRAARRHRPARAARSSTCVRSAPPMAATATRYHASAPAPGRKGRRTFARAASSFAAGALGTNELLARCKHGGALPGSATGSASLVRTNSEVILAVTLPADTTFEPSRESRSLRASTRVRTPISSSVTYGLKPATHVPVFTLLVGDGTRSPGR